MSGEPATRAFYGRWARLYDILATAPLIRSWRARAVEALGLTTGDTVVEMGVGTGANLPLLREAVGKRGRVVGVDITRGMLEVARHRIRNVGWDNVHLVQADATCPPHPGWVDAVLGSFVVGMFREPDRVIETWVNLVDGGGRVALLDAARSDRPLAAPINLGLRAFVRLTSPGKRDRSEPAIATLESRLDRADETLAALTVGYREHRFAGGFLRLRSGRLGGAT